MSPAVIIHVAGPRGPDDLQRCTRCGTVLKDFRHRNPTRAAWPLSMGVVYPVGAHVERGPFHQAMVIGAPSAAQCVRPADDVEATEQVQALAEVR